MSSSADHLGDAVEVLEEHFVPIILRAGDVRTTSTTWRKVNDAIAGEVREGARPRRGAGRERPSRLREDLYVAYAP